MKNLEQSQQDSPSSNQLHPVDILMQEHQAILAVLDAMENEARAISNSGKLRQDFWLNVSDFLENFADLYHHGKEEDLLFPCLVECGMGEENGPIGVMKHEHVEGRQFREKLHHSATSGDATGVQDAALGFAHLLRHHIDKENGILFQMAKQILPPEKVESLSVSFAKFAADAAPGSEVAFREQARQICADIASPTP